MKKYSNFLNEIYGDENSIKLNKFMDNHYVMCVVLFLLLAVIVIMKIYA